MKTVCHSCPRHCLCDRSDNLPGVCGVPAEFTVSRIAPHLWEEPPISGKNGSGAVFFTGCSLRCVFCQNKAISRNLKGQTLTDRELESRILALADTGVHNINLVTPTHYSERLVPFLKELRPKLPNTLPIVYNCGGYEDVETLRALEGLVDVYLPDFKYVSSDLSQSYSAAPDYCQIALTAVKEMFRQTGPVVFDENGLLRRGLVVRHLVLPGSRKDSMAVLRLLAETLPVKDIRLSLMSQYTPDFALDAPCQVLHRRLTSFEYESVLDLADKLGFEGYRQGKGAAKKDYTPDF